MNPRTEAAIRLWLEHPKRTRVGVIDSDTGTVQLFTHWFGEVIGTFTLASVIKKRYPARKKKAKK